MVDLLEEYFPKNKCKERGQAIVLICEIERMLQENLRERENISKRSKINREIKLWRRRNKKMKI